MLNLKFFNKMKSVLAFDSFNPINYTTDELQILFSNAHILNSEYCNPIFKEQAQNYFKAHRADLKINSISILTKDSPSTKPSETAHGKFMLLPDAEALIAELERLKKVQVTPIHREGIIMIKVDENCYTSLELEDYTEDKISEYFEIPIEIRKQILEIADYYHIWLPSGNVIQSNWHSMIDDLYKITGSLHLTQSLLSALKPAEDFNLITENMFNTGWDVEEKFEKFHSVNSEYKELYRELIKLKGWSGLNLALSLTSLSDEQSKFFTEILPRIKNTADNLELTAETANLIEKEILALTAISKDSSLPIPENCVSLNLPKLLELATKYKMPKDIIFNLINEEFPKFNLEEDNVVKLLTSISSASADSGASIGSFQFDLDIKVGGKKLKAELLAKNDPTALFVGKMINCCQFYTGDSSKEAVIPVFTDPNTGLIVIRTNSGQVKAASFAWLSKNETGDIDGLVLDSFEYHKEAGKAFVPFIKQLASQLAEKGLKLYVGSGGKTPMLHVKEGDEFVKLETIPQPIPLTEGFEPYGDASTVYHIEAEKEYSTKFKENFEDEDIQDFINKSLSDLSPDELDAMNQKFHEDHINKIAAYCLTYDYDFVRALKIASLFNSNEACTGFINKILSISNEQLVALSSTEGLQSLINTRFVSDVSLGDLLVKTRAGDYTKLKCYLENVVEKLNYRTHFMSPESAKILPIIFQNIDKETISKISLIGYNSLSENQNDFTITPDDSKKLNLFFANLKKGTEVNINALPAYINLLRIIPEDEIHKIAEFFSTILSFQAEKFIALLEAALSEDDSNIDAAIIACNKAKNYIYTSSLEDIKKYNLHKIGEIIDITKSFDGYVVYTKIMYLLDNHVDLAIVTEANFLELSTPKPAPVVALEAEENVGLAGAHLVDINAAADGKGEVEAIGEVNIVTAHIG